MLRFFRVYREKVVKYLMIFFLGIVSVGMVVTLTPLGGGDTSEMQANVLASLGGANITSQDVQRSLDAQFRNSPQGNSPAIMALMAPRVFDEMIQQRALLVQAKKLGLEVSNEELQKSLQPMLTVNGQFVGMDQYQNFVEQQYGMTVAQFEAERRDGMLAQKMRDVITDAVQVTPEEIKAEFMQRNEKAKIDYVLFQPSDFIKTVEVAPAALDAYFKENIQRYKQPAQRRLRYVLIDQDHVRATVKVGDADLQAYYSQHLSEYRVPDRVKASHILFKTTGKKPEEITALTAKAQDVLKQVKAGGDFADLAKKNSEDDTTAPKGGDLGWIVRGQTVKEFEDTAFSLPPGQVSGLVTTTYGIHVIKVWDKQTAHLQGFDEVKGAIQQTVEKQRLEQAQKTLADQLEQDLRANPQDFDSIVRKAGLETKETAPFKFNDTVPDLGKSEGLSNLAFQLKTGEVGQPLTLPKGVVIVQLAEVIPEHLPKLDEVRAQVEEDYKAMQSKTVASQKAQEFAAKVKGGDFKKVAQGMGLKVKESKDFARQDNVEDLVSGTEVGDAFTLNPGQTSGVVQVGVNSTVFLVVSHSPADETAFGQQQDQIREQLLDRKRSLAFDIYRTNLKQDLQRAGQLKINDAALKQFLAGYGKTT